jgi:hypothetical protein
LPGSTPLSFWHYELMSFTYISSIVSLLVLCHYPSISMFAFISKPAYALALIALAKLNVFWTAYSYHVSGAAYALLAIGQTPTSTMVVPASAAYLEGLAMVPFSILRSAYTLLSLTLSMFEVVFVHFLPGAWNAVDKTATSVIAVMQIWGYTPNAVLLAMFPSLLLSVPTACDTLGAVSFWTTPIHGVPTWAFVVMCGVVCIGFLCSVVMARDKRRAALAQTVRDATFARDERDRRYHLALNAWCISGFHRAQPMW